MKHAIKNVKNLLTSLAIAYDCSDLPGCYSSLGFCLPHYEMEITGQEGYFYGLCEDHFSEINMCYFLNEMPISEYYDRFFMFKSRMNKNLKLVDLQEHDISITKVNELYEKLF